MTLVPMAMYGLEVPAGDVAIPAVTDIRSAFRITMAAIDPSAEPEGDEGAVPRATLKVIRQPLCQDEDDEDDSDFDQMEMDRMLADGEDGESSEDDGVNGGPSDPQKSKKAQREAARDEIKKLLEEEGMDVDEVPNGVNGTAKSLKGKGKMPKSVEDEDESDEESDDLEGGEMEKFVICTLDPTKVCQDLQLSQVR